MQLTTTEIVVSSLAIFFGPVFGLYGYRLWKITLFFVASVLFTAGTYGLLTLSDLPEWAEVLIAVATGVLAGILAMCLLPLGLFLLGATAGGCLALLVLSTGDGGLITEDWAQYLFVGLLAIALGLITIAFQKLLIILTTSILGSYALVAGVSQLADPQGSFSQVVWSFLSNSWSTLDANWHTWLCVGVWAGLALIFVLVQFCITGKKHNHLHHHHHNKFILVDGQYYEPINE